MFGCRVKGLQFVEIVLRLDLLTYSCTLRATGSSSPPSKEGCFFSRVSAHVGFPVKRHQRSTAAAAFPCGACPEKLASRAMPFHHLEGLPNRPEALNNDSTAVISRSEFEYVPIVVLEARDSHKTPDSRSRNRPARPPAGLSLNATPPSDVSVLNILRGAVHDRGCLDAFRGQ